MPTIEADDGSLVSNLDNKEIYLMLDGNLRQVPNPATFNNLFNCDRTHMIVSQKFGPIGTPLTDGAHLAKTADNAAVYLLSDGVKRHVANAEVFERFQFDWNKIEVHRRSVVLDSIPSGPSIPQVLPQRPIVEGDDGNLVLDQANQKVYLKLDGKLRHVPNPATFNNLFNFDLGDRTRMIVSRNVDAIGTPLTDGAHLAKTANNAAVYLLSDGVKRHIADPEVFRRFQFDWNKIDVHHRNVALDSIPSGPTIR